MSGNKSWPDLVGKSADEAVVAIQNEKNDWNWQRKYYIFSFIDLSVIKFEQGSRATADLWNDRVRVFYDKNVNVSSEPSIG